MTERMSLETSASESGEKYGTSLCLLVICLTDCSVKIVCSEVSNCINEECAKSSAVKVDEEGEEEDKEGGIFFKEHKSC